MNKLIIFPTDTVYGIGCSIYDIYNIDRIYDIKKRDKSKPLACLCASLEQIKSIAYVNDLAIKLINKYLPGGLTLILKSKEEVKENGVSFLAKGLQEASKMFEGDKKTGALKQTDNGIKRAMRMPDYNTFYKIENQRMNRQNSYYSRMYA